MKDITPELQKSVLSDFYNMVEEDNKIQGILTGEDKRATLTQVSKQAERLGEYAVRSLKKNLTDETLPDGTLYWNIAKGVIPPLMREVQKVATDMAVRVQTREDKKAGIGLKPVSYTHLAIRSVIAASNCSCVSMILNSAIFFPFPTLPSGR